MQYDTFMRGGKKMYRLVSSGKEFSTYAAMAAHIHQPRPSRRPSIDKHSHVIRR